MSIILYGPQGTGKTTHAEQIRAKLKLCKVCEEDSFDFPRNLYSVWQNPAKAASLKARNTLFITNQDPPPNLHGDWRIIHIEDALRMIGRG